MENCRRSPFFPTIPRNVLLHNFVVFMFHPLQQIIMTRSEERVPLKWKPFSRCNIVSISVTHLYDSQSHLRCHAWGVFAHDCFDTPTLYEWSEAIEVLINNAAREWQIRERILHWIWFIQKILFSICHFSFTIRHVLPRTTYWDFRMNPTTAHIGSNIGAISKYKPGEGPREVRLSLTNNRHLL